MSSITNNKPNRKFVVSDENTTVYWEWTQATGKKIKQVQVSAFKDGQPTGTYTVKPGTPITLCKEDLRTKAGFSIKPATVSKIFLHEGALHVKASHGKSSANYLVSTVNSFNG